MATQLCVCTTAAQCWCRCSCSKACSTCRRHQDASRPAHERRWRVSRLQQGVPAFGGGQVLPQDVATEERGNCSPSGASCRNTGQERAQRLWWECLRIRDGLHPVDPSECPRSDEPPSHITCAERQCNCHGGNHHSNNGASANRATDTVLILPPQLAANRKGIGRCRHHDPTRVCRNGRCQAQPLAKRCRARPRVECCVHGEQRAEVGDDYDQRQAKFQHRPCGQPCGVAQECQDDAPPHFQAREWAPLAQQPLVFRRWVALPYDEEQEQRVDDAPDCKRPRVRGDPRWVLEGDFPDARSEDAGERETVECDHGNVGGDHCSFGCVAVHFCFDRCVVPCWQPG
mmetsp:Transcript_79458/g.199717  ORF Transcript_79458/g.199717 Transcript_79458/m.199717 type:complete len:343 (+) Transcript_79458:140-1168(+)